MRLKSKFKRLNLNLANLKLNHKFEFKVLKTDSTNPGWLNPRVPRVWAAAGWVKGEDKFVG